MSNHRTVARAAATLAAFGIVVAAGTQAAAGGAKILAVGVGTSAPSGAGLHYEGNVHGQPFDGAFSGHVLADDGSLPAVGSCEPAVGTLRVEGPGGGFYSLESHGQVCGVYLPLGVMQRFQGRWVVTETSRKKLARVDGHMDIRLMNGKSDVYAIDS